MASTTTVADCSASRYCTQPNVSLEYGNQLVVHWNNQFPPLTPESLVTISVYSEYDQTTPIYQITGVDNTNGMVTLKPDASWFSRYTGNNSNTGSNQKVFFAAYLQGNEPPAVSDMLGLQLTATPEQYAQIQSILHPTTSSALTAQSTRPTASDSEDLVKSTTSTGSSLSQTTQTDETETVSSPSLISSSLSSSFMSDSASASETSSSESSESSTTVVNVPSHDRHGLSPGAIAGIAVGSAVGLLLILLLLLLPLYRRRQHKRRMLEKSAQLGPASSFPGDGGIGSSTSELPSTGIAAAGVAAGGIAATATGVNNNGRASPSDTPLLVGGKPNNSFTSQDGSIISESATHMSPSTAYHPLSLDSPRVMMHVPASTRSSNLVPMAMKMRSDPILSSDDAKQIGDIFRDALRKPPASEEDASDGPHRESLMDLDDELGEEEDPGWRERVASERMQRELQQEASVIRSVAMRAHGSDYSSSRPATSRSDHTSS
ncbi:hypothetical protein FB645_003045 [Coemansia sp. IMI 203386]|nr:hypothetical protein FB645_003045 [Coemansia sp. IMI 203386]